MNNNETQLLTEEPQVPRKFFLPTLVIVRFVTVPPAVLTALLLIDIGKTFNRPVGVMGQLATGASLIGAIVAVLMGAWSVRFNHKSLLMIGLLLCSISTVGCAIAPNFPMMLIFYSLIFGIGGTMVTPMALTLVARFTLEKRSSAIGWLSAGAALAFPIGAPVISFIDGIGGWRWAFLGFTFPISLLGLTMTLKGIPSSVQNPQLRSTGTYLEGFKSVFSNRSAIACLIGTAFSYTGWQAIVYYSASFFRERFEISTGLASLILVVAALVFTLGTLAIGRFVTQLGRKPLTVVTGFGTGIFIITFTNVSNLWLSIALMCLGCLFYGMMVTTSYSLTLEQVPSYRGSMMSMHSAAWMLGAALGAGGGGLLLLLYDYGVFGLALGTMSFASALVYYLLAVDPTSTDVNHEPEVTPVQSTEVNGVEE